LAGWERDIPGHLAGQAEGLEAVQQVLLDPGEREHGPGRAEFCAERVYRFQGGEIHLDVRLDVEHEPADRTRLLARGGQRAAAEISGVGEEQWCVAAVHHQPRHGLGGRVVVDVVHAGQAGDRVVRPGYPPQQLGDGQADGQQDAVENAEGEDAGAGGQGQQHLVTAESQQPPAGVAGVGLAADPATGRYWILKSNGGVSNVHAPWYGSLNGTIPAGQAVTAIAGE
jgi:hypothetical protein